MGLSRAYPLCLMQRTFPVMPGIQHTKRRELSLMCSNGRIYLSKYIFRKEFPYSREGQKAALLLRRGWGPLHVFFPPRRVKVIFLTWQPVSEPMCPSAWKEGHSFVKESGIF